jgi:hypothetical protein
VHRENRTLDDFKNKFLPSAEGQPGGGRGTEEGGHGGDGGDGSVEWGDEPEALEYTLAVNGIQIGRGVTVSLKSLLQVSVRDAKGRPSGTERSSG